MTSVTIPIAADLLNANLRGCERRTLAGTQPAAHGI
jgi:hypothetical protein